MDLGRDPTAGFFRVDCYRYGTVNIIGALSDQVLISILLSNIGFWPPTMIALLLVCRSNLHLCGKLQKVIIIINLWRLMHRFDDPTPTPTPTPSYSIGDVHQP